MIILNQSNKLVISFKFPPDNDVSGIVVAKRIINDNSKVDVLHNHIDEEHFNFENADELINKRLETVIHAKRDSIECIDKFINQGLDLIGSTEYKEIYSRSWYMSNHYLALEYKFNHPDVIWTAEFSDPILRDMHGNIKNYGSAILDNQKYIDKLNDKIKDLNFPILDNPNNTFFIAEYLTFLFADKIIFTNTNQRDMMLELYDEDIKEIVIEKSQIMPHPTLDKKYYYLKESNIDLDKNDVNIGYFGSFYYTLRHFEPLFYAYESLNHKFKDRIKFHIFLNDDEFLKDLIDEFDFKDNIIIKKPLKYLEFLNATTKFDILLINDTITENKFTINPYLPSKLSDCKGSQKDIWIIYEDDSALSRQDVKYKSPINDYTKSRDILVQILKDYGYEDENFSSDEHYYEKRITDLNEIVRKEFDAKKRLNAENAMLKKDIKELKASYNKLEETNKKLEDKNKKLKKSNNKLKDENKNLKEKYNEILSSNSWRITRPLRNLKKR